MYSTRSIRLIARSVVEAAGEDTREDLTRLMTRSADTRGGTSLLASLSNSTRPRFLTGDTGGDVHEGSAETRDGRVAIGRAGISRSADTSVVTWVDEMTRQCSRSRRATSDLRSST